MALPAADVLGYAQKYVRDLAATSSPASMAIMKRQVYQQAHVGLLAAEHEARQLMTESFGRPDFAEGVAIRAAAQLVPGDPDERVSKFAAERVSVFLSYCKNGG
jgi:enoyl-CoA hydratase/carnithine racemase